MTLWTPSELLAADFPAPKGKLQQRILQYLTERGDARRPTQSVGLPTWCVGCRSDGFGARRIHRSRATRQDALSGEGVQ